MSYLAEDLDDLKQIFDYINQNNDVMSPFWLQGVGRLQSAPTRVEITPDLFVPISGEAARILRNLRQRMDPSDNKNPLVSQMRAEVRSRYRPLRDIQSQSLQGILKELAEIGGQGVFSKFQTEGWKLVLQVLNRAQQNKPAGLAITAPTGAGKTEVFLLPLIHEIVSALRNVKSSTRKVPRFAIIYPRIALAQDQIARAFRYIEQAERPLKLPLNQRVIVGLQFTGVRSGRENTLKDPNVFRHNGSNYEFLLLDTCPWCNKKMHLIFKAQFNYTSLECPLCKRQVLVSLSKDDHRDMQPHLMLTTAESLDRMYLDWDFKDYLPLLHGIILDEAHLFNQIYGAHIHRLLVRIRNLVQQNSNYDVAFIASSATIADSADFANRLFFGSNPPNGAVDVIDAEIYPKDLSGIETFYFLQAPKGQFGRTRALSTMIQTIMAMGHGVLRDDRRMIVFAESLDIAGRLQVQTVDAEAKRELWRMRIDIQSSQFMFNGSICPQTNPWMCSEIYEKGECWRGTLGGCQCFKTVAGLRNKSLPIQIITGGTQGQRSFQSPIIIGTSALEVGIDDSSVQATLHYRPPRTIFDFIQRRGRAGRQQGDSAYTIMILGNDPSDYFYLARRHRLIDGTYELPLNPDNPVVKEIHDWLEKARKEAFAQIQICKEQEGIWRWILAQLESCPYICTRYGTELHIVRQYTGVEQQQNQLKSWIERGLNEAKGQLGVEWEIPRRRQQLSNPGLLAIMDDLVNSFKEWLDASLSDQNFTKELNRLQQEAGNFVTHLQTISSSPATLANEYAIILRSILEVQEFARQTRAQVQQTLQSGKAWYEFFSRLNSLFDGYNLIILGAAVKIVYQAFYLLHQGLGSHTCPTSIPVYVPDNYFGGILPMRVELPGNRIVSEPITFLSTVFPPYRVNYRYEENSLFTLETRTLGKAQVDQVRLRPEADGPLGKDPKDRQIIHVRGIQLRKLLSDANQNLGVCQSCLQVYDLSRQNTTCRCGGSIQAGRLYVITNYIDNGFSSSNPIPIASSFALLPSLTAWTTLYGVDASFSPQNAAPRRFKAWLNPALYYELPTKGIQWKVPGSPTAEQLYSAANILLKAMAAIVGVREDKLAYSYEVSNGTVLVWETSEGGAGLCEIFADILQKNPFQVYLEMVAVVACPIYLAEQYKKLWNNTTELIRYLADQFGLSPSESLLQEIASEASAESQHRDKDGQVCAKYDGCPACIQSSLSKENESPKRSIAWQLVQSLIHPIPMTQLGTMLSSLPGPVIWVDAGKGLSYVLVF